MTRGEKVCAFIEQYCIVPEGDKIGRPFKLEPFQRRFVLDVYDNPYGTHSAYLSIARKNGKTGLIAALLLAHIAGPEAVLNSQIVSGAQSKDQAAVVFELAHKMVDLSPKLSLGHSGSAFGQAVDRVAQKCPVSGIGGGGQDGARVEPDSRHPGRSGTGAGTYRQVRDGDHDRTRRLQGRASDSDFDPGADGQ